MKKNFISLLTRNNKIEIRLQSKSFIWTSAILPKQARLLAIELLKAADLAEESEESVPHNNIVRMNFRRRGV